MDKTRADAWIVMYSVIDRSNLEKVVFELIKESMRYRSDLWTVFLSCGKIFSLLSLSTLDPSSSSISHAAFLRCIRTSVMTHPRIHRVCRLFTRTIDDLIDSGTIDELFLILEMTQFQVIKTDLTKDKGTKCADCYG